jgi:cell division septation protein DedD
MRQPASRYDDEERDDGFELHGEERFDDDPEPRARRFPAILLTVAVMALFAGGLWFAYVQGTRHAIMAAAGGEVPLIRADPRPIKVKPDEPGGMRIPDQNVSLYDERSERPALERLLPPPEQPMPRPVPEAAPEPPPAPPEAASPPPAIVMPASPPLEGAAPAAQPASPPPPPAKPPVTAAAEPKPAASAKPPSSAQPSSPQSSVMAAQAAPAQISPIQVRLGSVRSPDAAREEWARLKRTHSDLLGSLSGFAVRTDLGERGIYYRIQAGPLPDRAAAERLCSEMKQRNSGCLLAR